MHAGWRDAAGQPLELPSLSAVVDWLGRFVDDREMVDVNLDDGFITADMLADPPLARGRCHSASEVFADYLAEQLPGASPRNQRGEWVGYGRFEIGGRDDDEGSGIREHHAVIVATDQGPHVVDLTARQFDPDLPFPLVEPLPAYAARPTWWSAFADFFVPDPRTDPPELQED